MRAAASSLLVCLACSPPASVKAVDAWLAGYTAQDVDRMVTNTWPGDRALVRKCMNAMKTDPRGGFALALPPLPLEHEILEIEKKPSSDRHVVLTKIKMKNPLPFEAERMGQDLGDFPRTRSQRRRFLSVRTSDGWGVKLDLAAVMKRAAFVDSFTADVEAGRFDAALKMLDLVPPLPDEANVSRTDRLAQKLRADLKKAQKRRRVATSSTSTSAGEIKR